MIFKKIKDHRTQNIVSNIAGSVITKGGNVVIGLILVPLTINYINPLQYGIWLTISSIVSWLGFFDIGLGNGLRNRLTYALTLKEKDKAQMYVSTTYAALFFIAIIVFILFCIVNLYLDWRLILNVPRSVPDNIQTLFLIVVGTFCLQLVAQVINSVLTATHKPALVGLISFLGQLITLVVMLRILKTTPGTLSLFTVVMMVVPLMVLIVASIILFSTQLKQLAPSLKGIKIRYVKDIVNIGGSFFFIQTGALILLYTNSIVITRIVGPEAVTEFNISYRLYSVVTVFFTIIITPYWSAFTEAFAKENFFWMKKNLHYLRLVWALLVVFVIPSVYFTSEHLFKLWLGDSVTIPRKLSLAMGLYTVGHTALVLNSFILNGIGKLKLQLYLFITICFLNIPLSIALGKHYGTVGVTLSSVVIFLFLNTILWIQSSKIVNRTAYGIWNS